MNKILIIGAAGFIVYHLAKVLSERGGKVLENRAVPINFAVLNKRTSPKKEIHD